MLERAASEPAVRILNENGLDDSLWTLAQEQGLMRDADTAAEIEIEGVQQGRERDAHVDQGARMDATSLSSDNEDEVLEIVPLRSSQRPRWPTGALNPAAPLVLADLDAPGAMEVDGPIKDDGPDEDEAPFAHEPRCRPTRRGRCLRCVAACRLIPPTGRTHFQPLWVAAGSRHAPDIGVSAALRIRGLAAQIRCACAS